MNIEDLTIGQARELVNLFAVKSQETSLCPLPIGKNVFIRTVTHYYTGHLKSVSGGFLVLEKAAWIADTGRFSDAMKTGELNEVEPFPSDRLVFISQGAVVDVCEWAGTLPLVKK